MPPVCFLIDHSFRYRTILWCSVSILMTDFDHRINSMGKSKSFWYRWHPYTVIGLSTFKFFLSSSFYFESKIEKKIKSHFTSMNIPITGPSLRSTCSRGQWSVQKFSVIFEKLQIGKELLFTVQCIVCKNLFVNKKGLRQNWNKGYWHQDWNCDFLFFEHSTLS